MRKRTDPRRMIRDGPCGAGEHCAACGDVGIAAWSRGVADSAGSVADTLRGLLRVDRVPLAAAQPHDRDDGGVGVFMPRRVGLPG